jgi:hypothetical protein
MDVMRRRSGSDEAATLSSGKGEDRKGSIVAQGIRHRGSAKIAHFCHDSILW